MRRREDPSAWDEVPPMLLAFNPDDWSPLVEGAPPAGTDPALAGGRALGVWKRARAAWCDSGHPVPVDGVDRARGERAARLAMLDRGHPGPDEKGPTA